jgi:SAM-dependent methyltransferase
MATPVKLKPESLRRRINNYSVYRTLRRAIRDCKPSGPILLAPCGYGWFFEKFRKDNIDVVGIDIEEKKIEVAKRKVDPPFKTVLGNVLDMPFKEGQFDFVIANRFLLHFNDDFRAKAFKALRRVTNKHLLVHYDYVTSIRQWTRKLRNAESPEIDFSKYEGYRIWKRHGRKLRYTRDMMAKEGADAGLKLVGLYFVAYLLSERVYCLYEKV